MRFKLLIYEFDMLFSKYLISSAPLSAYFRLPCTQNFVLREHLIFSTVNTDFCCSVNTFARRLLICTLI
jgi:hypothetical protein